jgi:hypothetical protein
MNDDEVIAEARALCAAVIGPIGEDWSIVRMVEAIEQLADIAEKRGAMLLGKEAISRYQRNHPTNQEWEALQDQYYKEAQEALDIESTSWRKIGPEDVAVLKLFLEYISHFKADGHLVDTSDITTKQGIQVLRRLMISEE